MWNQTLRFARCIKNDKTEIILVTHIDEAEIHGHNLTDKYQLKTSNILQLFENLTFEELIKLSRSHEKLAEKYSASEFMFPTDGSGKVLCAGLNYRDHVKETGSAEKLLIFSKVCDPTSPEEILIPEGVDLLDYEVELGAVFDRDVGSMNDFHSAYVGYFVANDVTSRCQQIRNSVAGTSKGFGDSKSYPGYLPMGAILAVPEPPQREAFEKSLKLQLKVNGEIRQESSTDLMIYSISEILQEIFRLDKEGFSCVIQGKETPLLSQGRIPAGTLIISGTPGGTAFHVPNIPTKLSLVAKTLMFGSRRGGDSFGAKVKNLLIEHEKKNGSKYLKSGDRVVAEIKGLGTSKLEIRE